MIAPIVSDDGMLHLFVQFDRRTLSVAIRFLRAKTPEERAAVDLDTHYTEVYKNYFPGVLVIVNCSKDYLYPSKFVSLFLLVRRMGIRLRSH